MVVFGSLTTETETPNPVSRHSNPLYVENCEGREIDRQEWMAELLMQLGTDLLTSTLIHPAVVESQNKQWKK